MFPKAKKSFGQNWLVDHSVIEKILEAAETESGERVLEIGPGTGVLTKALVETGAKVTAVEIDRTLISSLQDMFEDRIQLLEGDILSEAIDAHLRDLFLDGQYTVIANIPYNITSAILRRFLERPPHPKRMVLMVQKEVADRIVAQPPRMSLLSVICQVHAVCKKIANVPKGAFRPMPKVDSAIIRLDVLGEQQEIEPLMQLAKAGFASKRKQLQKNLSALPEVRADDVKTWLVELGLDPRARAETLSMDDWRQLTHIYQSQRRKNT